MSCHYSCASCSASIYMFNCTSCPATRQLIDSTCQCNSGYYEAQQASCYPSSQADALTQLILPIATGYFYTTIALFWLYAIILFCRVNSPKIRIALNFAQIIALLKYYPFIFDQISKQFINSLSPLNFNYFSTFFTCDTNSTICTLFQYIWQPLLLLPALLITFFVSYLLMSICYKNQLGESFSVKNFWYSNWFLMIYYFIDFTAVIYGYNITKAVLLSYWGFIFVGVYFIILVLVCVKFFKIINNQEQGKIVYRGKYSWAFGYDEQYHLYFIDFLYTEATVAKNEVQKKNNTTTINLSNLLQTKLQMPKKISPNKLQQQKISMFVPHSNLYLFQLFLKIFIASSTALLFTYKPTFIVIPLIILINIIVCWLGAFLYYDKLSLLIYFVMSCAVVISVSFYWLTIFWIIAILDCTLIIAIKGGSLIALFFVNRKIKGKLVKKIFEEQEVQEIKKLEKEQQQQSQQELLIRNGTNNRTQKQKLQSLVQPSQQNVTKLQPFTGNLTRKTKLKKTQTMIPIIKQQKDEKTNTILNSNGSQQKVGKVTKVIFNDQISEKNNDEQKPQQNIIRHSKYQRRLSGLQTKISARNRTKNPFDDLDQGQQQYKYPQNYNKNQSLENKQRTNQNKNQGQKLQSKSTSKNKTKRNTLNKDREDDFLSNVLEQPAQQDLNQNNGISNKPIL